MRRILIGFAAIALITSGCSRFTGRSRSAVREAIQEHLREQPGLQMQNMSMEVNDVRFKGDTADAQVKFVSRESPQAFVVIRYQLRKEGGKWQVQSTSRMEMGGNPHGQMSGTGRVPNPHDGGPVEGPMGPVPQPRSSH